MAAALVLPAALETDGTALDAIDPACELFARGVCPHAAKTAHRTAAAVLVLRWVFMMVV
jgi:hypothetical protein